VTWLVFLPIQRANVEGEGLVRLDHDGETSTRFLPHTSSSNIPRLHPARKRAAGPTRVRAVTIEPCQENTCESRSSPMGQRKTVLGRA
jgi:hypothetical protein